MTRFSSILRCWTVCLLCAFCASSDGPCTVLCALPQAFTVTVTSSVSGGPIPGAYVTGDPYGAGDGSLCNQAPGSTCYCPGSPAGTLCRSVHRDFSQSNGASLSQRGAAIGAAQAPLQDISMSLWFQLRELRRLTSASS